MGCIVGVRTGVTPIARPELGFPDSPWEGMERGHPSRSGIDQTLPSEGLWGAFARMTADAPITVRRMALYGALLP